MQNLLTLSTNFIDIIYSTFMKQTFPSNSKYTWNVNLTCDITVWVPWALYWGEFSIELYGKIHCIQLSAATMCWRIP